MTNETITLVAESAPFWGIATTLWLYGGIALFALLTIFGFAVEEAGLVVSGFWVGVIAVIFGLIFSGVGVQRVEDNSLQQQLREVVRVENLDYNNKDFTGSIDGRYVKGTLVHIGGKEYQVVELVTGKSSD